jgi:hypothetical protein
MAQRIGDSAGRVFGNAPRAADTVEALMDETEAASGADAVKPRHPLISEALAWQEVERGGGFATANPSLDALRSQFPPSDLRDLVHELRQGGLPERELAARLLAHSSLPGASVVDEVRGALEAEEDPQVIRWLVAALQHAGEPTALPELRTLANHPDARVRFGVPDALSSCSDQFKDVADTMICLSKDDDREVRWSATFELAAWLTCAASGTAGADLARLLSRVQELAASDPDPEIRAAAAAAVEEAQQL